MLVFNLFTHENITIETLYNATLNLFNDAKNRINNLFSLKKLNTPALNKELNISPPPPEHKETEPKSFQYCNSTQLPQLESIFNLLIKGSYIDVKLNDFTLIFTNIVLSTIKPIDWKGNSIASLRYFIKQFTFEMSVVNKYKITAYCFTHKGTKLKFSQINNAKQVSKKDKRAIDNIFKHYPFIK